MTLHCDEHRPISEVLQLNGRPAVRAVGQRWESALHHPFAGRSGERNAYTHHKADEQQ
jgi:hypothetical protein